MRSINSVGSTFLIHPDKYLDKLQIVVQSVAHAFDGYEFVMDGRASVVDVGEAAMIAIVFLELDDLACQVCFSVTLECSP